jgi:16S rRNA A1518/A1519 N6-dimethyltransferase RsmA/KsgA/DIM1 with predicted DNA glycosylase/AP lyase activity
LALGAARVIAVERDDRAIGALHEIATHYPGRLEIVAADALSFDARTQLRGARARIVANLPYNIATALLVMWVTTEPWPPWYDSAVLMFQREVAERIVAEVGGKNYGRLSVLVQWRCEARIVFDVNASAFVPPPKVKSSVVRIVPRSAPLPCRRDRACDLWGSTRRSSLPQRDSIRPRARKTFRWSNSSSLRACSRLGVTAAQQLKTPTPQAIKPHEPISSPVSDWLRAAAARDAGRTSGAAGH